MNLLINCLWTYPIRLAFAVLALLVLPIILFAVACEWALTGDDVKYGWPGE